MSESDLKRAFKRAALQHHPDKNLENADEAKEVFHRITHAYEYLTECVARGCTGPNQPRGGAGFRFGDSDDNDGYYYYDDGDDSNNHRHSYVDLEELLFRMFAAKMEAAFRQQHRAPHSSPFFSSGRGRSYNNNDMDDHLDRMAEQARQKEARRQKEKRAHEEHERYMAARAEQARREGRDFFESWNINQLQGECQRRGIPAKQLQKNDIVEVLIADETKKRLRKELKAAAPLLDEWAEVIHMEQRVELNGMKVRVVDFYDGTLWLDI